ncbi:MULTISPECIES: hypothetical protein [Enterococcus]|uniref:Uncharacterized protein n=2 Tax=Enterococcus faecium TaxID=1352 RepID=A0A6S6MIL7_ENTFC|nr:MULTISPECIES: hypothetical protein [Enterococcus]HAP4612828.1 hypothetical protein [Enterococcus faecalis]AUH49240.1 hypothetical protein CX663_15985 [Enterococcus faecium]EOG20462.1 hypothetical protein SMG_03147 [Enterococcus faecium EnGen0180]MBW4139227.1 hypothetical protein [Enterococcus faecium]MBY3649850.1 hypothetical protein [Enterococcus faecium]
MKLEGSLQNRMMEGSTTNKEIVVGMGATELLYTDRNPYTVIEVKSKNRILVQADGAINKATFPDQEWEYSRNPEGQILELVKTKNGWKVLKEDIHFYIGDREKYYDPSF